MNRILLVLVSVFMVLSGGISAQTFMVFSDPHVLAPSLTDGGAALQSAAESDPKLIEYSARLFDSVCAVVERAHPDILLIPGDLSKDGELASHQYVSARLNKIVDAGTRVLVVPGNHDLDNPGAKSYFGTTASSVPSISLAEFESLYARCGFSDAVALNSADGSYMSYPAPGLAILCLNSARPNNTPAGRYSDGAVTRATLAWACQQAKVAQADHRTVIAMMHHPIMEHFDGHATLAPTYMANVDSTCSCSADSLQNVLLAAGIRVVFTGHFHIHSCSNIVSAAGDTLVDVSTGSLCSYASPFRRMEWKNGVLSISSEEIDTYHMLEQQRNANTTRGAINRYAPLAYMLMDSVLGSVPQVAAVRPYLRLPKSEAELRQQMLRYGQEPLSNMLNLLARGDEDVRDPESKCYNALMDSLNAYIDYVADSKVSSNFMTSMGISVVNALAKQMVEGLLSGPLQSISFNYVRDFDNLVPDAALQIVLPAAVPNTTALHHQAEAVRAEKSISGGQLRVSTEDATYSVGGQRL